MATTQSVFAHCLPRSRTHLQIYTDLNGISQSFACRNPQISIPCRCYTTNFATADDNCFVPPPFDRITLSVLNPLLNLTSFLATTKLSIVTLISLTAQETLVGEPCRLARYLLVLKMAETRSKDRSIEAAFNIYKRLSPRPPFKTKSIRLRTQIAI